MVSANHLLCGAKASCSLTRLPRPTALFRVGLVRERFKSKR